MPKLQRAKTVACGLLRWDRCCIIVVSHWSKPAGQTMASLLVVVAYRTSHSMPKEESHVIFSKSLPLKAGTLPLLQAPAHGRAAGLVGREDALAQLHQWWAQARQGRRQVGIIAGEPGMGKTALVATFVGQVRAREALWVGHGQCVEAYGAGEPYLPLLEAVGRLCRSPAGAPLVALLRQYAPSWLGQLPALLPPAAWEALQRTLG